MSNAVIGYVNSKGIVKTVTVACNGEIDELGIELLDNFKTLTDVKELAVSSIDYIEGGEVEYIDDIDELDEDLFEFSEYSSKDDLLEDISDCIYYLFEKDKWYVLKRGFTEFEELDIIIEQEY